MEHCPNNHSERESIRYPLGRALVRYASKVEEEGKEEGHPQLSLCYSPGPGGKGKFRSSLKHQPFMQSPRKLYPFPRELRCRQRAGVPSWVTRFPLAQPRWSQGCRAPRRESSRLELGSCKAKAEAPGRGDRETGGRHVPKTPPCLIPARRDPKRRLRVPKRIGHRLRRPPKILPLAPGRHELGAAGVLGCARPVLCPRFLPLAGAAGGLAAPSLLINTSGSRGWPGQGSRTAGPAPLSPWVPLPTLLCPRAGAARSESLPWGQEPELEPLILVACPRIWKNPATSDPASDRWDTGTGWCDA